MRINYILNACITVIRILFLHVYFCMRHVHIYVWLHHMHEIRRPRPSPRQGRRLGPPQVWSLFLLACYYLAFCQALRPLPSVVKGVQACRLPGLKCLKRCAAASSRHSGHCPLLLRAFKPAVCHLKRCAAASGRHSRHCPLLLRAFKPAVCQASNA